MTNNALETMATNCVKVWIGDKTVLFSYSVPVALWVRGNGEVKRYALEKAPTKTSARHLNQFGPERYVDAGEHLEKVTAEQLDALLSA